MEKIQIIKIIVIISLIVSVFTFLMYFISANTFGGCYIRTEVKNIDNPENLNIEIKPGTCVERFKIVNHEEGLILYAIKGDIITFDNSEIGTLDNVLLCLRGIPGSQWSKDLVTPIDDAQLCSPINLDIEQEYSIERIKNSWELFTNKGNIKGYTEYSNPSIKRNETILNISKISGIVFIISLIVLLILKKKR